MLDANQPEYMGRTTIQVSDELADDLHERKQRGDSYEDVIWRLIEAAETESRQEARKTSSSDPLTSIELPGSVDRESAVRAIHAARDHLRREGEATKQDLIVSLMPDHPLGYDVDEALSKLDVGERYRGAWWRRVVKPGLKALPEVEKPVQGGSRWRYIGDNDG
jgi:predicted CopG family antitoxin